MKDKTFQIDEIWQALTNREQFQQLVKHDYFFDAHVNTLR